MHYVADDLGAVGGRESHLQLASGGHHKVRGLVLVRVRMPTDDDGLLPAGDEARDVLADDGLAEDGASQNVADGAVGRPPHELELELLHALLVRSDRRTLDAHVVLLDGLRAVHGHLVVRLVTVLHAQVVPSNGGGCVRKVRRHTNRDGYLRVQLNVQEGQDELVLDRVPDNARHLVSENIHHGSSLDLLRHSSRLGMQLRVTQ